MKKFLLFLLPLLALAALILLLRTPPAGPDGMRVKYANSASRFVKGADGLSIRYRDQENKNGVPIVLIHGAAASLHSRAPPRSNASAIDTASSPIPSRATA